MLIKVPEKNFKVSQPDLKKKRIKDIYLSFRYLNADSPSEKIYKVYDAFDVDLKRINIIYGKSGTGKSSLLNFLSLHLNSYTLDYYTLGDNNYIIDLIGDDTKEAIEILNYVGLGEGNLFLRTPSQLSEGQLFRFKIAYLINKLKRNEVHSYILIDEFAGTLDLSTAKGIARMFHKICCKYNNINFIICCNNYEIVSSFKYDVLIKLFCDSSVEIEYSNKLLKIEEDRFELKKVNFDEYLQFKKYHYLDLKNSNYDIYIVKDKIEKVDVACIVLSKVFPVEFLNLHTAFRQINDSIINIKRLVVLPEYRSQGITRFILKRLSEIRSEKIIEVSSALFHFIPIPISLGFDDVNYLFDGYYNLHRENNYKLNRLIKSSGFNTWDLLDDSKYEKFLKIVNYNVLYKLVKEDIRERDESLVYYYYELMKKYNLKIDGNINELKKILFENDIKNVSKNDMKEIIQNNEQPSYGTFSTTLK